MLRRDFAVGLFAVLAAWGMLRAGGEEPTNPLRSPLMLNPPRQTFVALPEKRVESLISPVLESPEGEEIAYFEDAVDNQPPPPPNAGELPPRDWIAQGEQEEMGIPAEACELSCLERWAIVRQGHRDPSDPQRHFGFGEPLLDSSWRNRPWHVSAFAGGIMGDDLKSGEIELGGGFLAGARLGGDFDHYWGAETRLAFSNLNVTYPGFLNSTGSNVSLFDASLVHYPWGDARWRPYLTVGIGVAGYRYEDLFGTPIRATALTIPWGGGVKYLFSRNMALRFELLDNFSLAAGDRVDAMHNFSFTGGIEYHFGGRPTLYGNW